MKTLLFPLLALVGLTLSAPAQNGGVAVLDIDEVARQLGIEEKVRVDLLNMQNNLNADLKRSQETMQKQMTGVEEAAGKNPSDEQKRQIVATNQQLNEEFNRLKAQAQNTLAQERARMINEFRVRIEPIALKAAREIGLDVVLMKVTPPVFSFSTAVDITQATTKMALEAGMQVNSGGVTNAPAPATGSSPARPPVAAPVATPMTDEKDKGEGKSKGTSGESTKGGSKSESKGGSKGKSKGEPKAE
jgi:Skp family chaperone for outer membrane proteins